jgi:site-specific DNA-methyltransferase (adenine-specific)
MEFMEKVPDKYYELAIVDPPYGIGDWIPQTISKKGGIKASAPVTWNDKGPDDIYFSEVRRTSKKWIIWGANYFNCFDSGALVWYKGNINPNFSQCEIASLSFQKKVDYVHLDWQAGFYRTKKEGEQIHPCQKPVALYKWLLQNYAKPGDKILDTHGGSGSICIACHDMGFDLDWIELDEDYYNTAVERYKNHAAQGELFSIEGGQLV